MTTRSPSFTGVSERVSPEWIRAVIADDEHPVVRNLKITQAYSDLSLAIAEVIGAENVNWCTFATWASKTAGRFIRLEEVGTAVETALHQSSHYQSWVELIHDKLADAGTTPDLVHESVIGAVGDVVGDVSADLAAGNLKVFAELGPIFAEMLRAFSQPGSDSPAALEAFLDSLQLEPGPSVQSREGDGEGGQNLLRSALTHYHAAIRERAPKRKAELVLLANAQIGLHEQIRLQPYIAGSMTAPLRDAVTMALHGKHAHGILDHLRNSVLATLFHAVANEVEHAWVSLLTRFTMDLYLPDGVVRLGRGLPHPPGEPLFPPLLKTITDEHLRLLLTTYAIDPSDDRCAGAREWSSLADRMRYIFELFRSRQRDARLLSPPFSAEQRERIDEGQVPSGPL